MLTFLYSYNLIDIWLCYSFPLAGPPEKPVLYLSPSGELKAGDSVTITCQSESGPQGRVALRQLTGSQGAELQSNQGHTSITVQSLTARDSGLYECQATNPYGKQTSSINITVFNELYTETQRTTATVASMTVQCKYISVKSCSIIVIRQCFKYNLGTS